MISDITIGQYYSGTSVIHRMDARMKFVLTMALIVILFVCRNFYSLALGLIFVVATLLLSKVPMKMMWRSIKPLVILMLFTAVINVFYNRGGETLVSFWKITITTTGVYTAIFTTVRIILLVVVSSLLTYTTTPTMLTDALERLLSPLKVIKVPVHTLAMIMTLALRFIPVLIEEIERIMNAQKARGSELDTGTMGDKVRGMIPIFIPLFVSSFRRASDLANAMECRCYTGGEGRTRMNVLHAGIVDFVAVLLVVFAGAAVVLINRYAPGYSMSL